MIRLGLRLHRGGLAGYTLLTLFVGYAQGAAFAKLAGTTAEARHAFGQQMTALGAQIAYLLPLPVRVDTASGYLAWRLVGASVLIFVVWVIFAAAGAARGDEEKGLTDTWLAAGLPRTGYMAFRLVAFALAVLVAAAGMTVGAALGLATAQGQPADRLDVGGAVSETLIFWLLTLCLFTLGLLIGQFFTSGRAAAGANAIVLVTMFAVNGLGRTAASLDVPRRFTPFYWFDRSDPLVPGGGVDRAGVAALVAVTAAAFALAAVLFARRDTLSAVWRRRPEPSGAGRHGPSPLLRFPVLRLLYRQRVGLAAWVGAAAVLAFYLTSLAKPVIDALGDNELLKRYLAAAGHGDPAQAYVSTVWFGIAQLLIAGFAILQVSGWAGEDSEGMLELTLSEPVPRWGVVTERALTALLGIAIVVAAGSLATWAGATVYGISLNAADMLRASALLLPFGMAFAAVGAFGIGLVPRVIVGILAAVAVWGYIAYQVGALLEWPDWVVRLSFFKLYGAPLTNGVDWPGLWTMLVVIALGMAGGYLAMARRDVGS